MVSVQKLLKTICMKCMDNADSALVHQRIIPLEPSMHPILICRMNKEQQIDCVCLELLSPHKKRPSATDMSGMGGSEVHIIRIQT